MKHYEEEFQGKKGLKLYCQSWFPDSEVKAILLVVHGIAEHSGRYTGLVTYFTSRGYLVCALDHRGHGRSEGRRGHVEHFSYFIDDLNTFVELVRRRNTGKKVFLFGHSMGSTICLGFATRHPQEAAGLILSGTALKIKPELPVPLVALLKSAAVMFPTLRIKQLDSAFLSRNRAVVAAYDSDSLVFRGKLSLKITVDLLWETQTLVRRLSQIQLPLLILHGEADQLTMPEGSRLIFKRVQSQDKSLKLYQGFYHEILNEPGHEVVLKDMESWISSHL
jgi:acylglycerol lipase